MADTTYTFEFKITGNTGDAEADLKRLGSKFEQSASDVQRLRKSVDGLATDLVRKLQPSFMRAFSGQKAQTAALIRELQTVSTTIASTMGALMGQIAVANTQSVRGAQIRKKAVISAEKEIRKAQDATARNSVKAIRAHSEALREDAKRTRAAVAAAQKKAEATKKSAQAEINELHKLALAEDRVRTARERSAQAAIRSEAHALQRRRQLSGARASAARYGARGAELLGTGAQGAEHLSFLRKSTVLTYHVYVKWLLLSGAITAAGLAFSRFAFTFTNEMEQAEIGISGVLASMAQLKDAQGNILSGAEKFAASQRVAGNSVAYLAERSLQSSATFKEMVTTFQAIAGVGLSAGMTLRQIADLAELGAVATKSLGLATNQVVQEMRDLVQGGIQPQSSAIATSIRVTDKMVKKWRETGDLYEQLTKRLGPMREAGELATLTMSVGFQKLAEVIARVGGEAFEGFHSDIVRLINDIRDRLTEVNAKTGSLSVRSDAVAAFKRISDGLRAMVPYAVALGSAIGRAALAIANFVSEHGHLLRLIATIATLRIVWTGLFRVINGLGVNSLVLVVRGFIRARTHAISFNRALITVAGSAKVARTALNSLTKGLLFAVAAEGILRLVELLTRAKDKSRELEASLARIKSGKYMLSPEEELELFSKQLSNVNREIKANERLLDALSSTAVKLSDDLNNPTLLFNMALRTQAVQAIKTKDALEELRKKQDELVKGIEAQRKRIAAQNAPDPTVSGVQNVETDINALRQLIRSWNSYEKAIVSAHDAQKKLAIDKTLLEARNSLTLDLNSINEAEKVGSTTTAQAARDRAAAMAYAADVQLAVLEKERSVAAERLRYQEEYAQAVQDTNYGNQDNYQTLAEAVKETEKLRKELADVEGKTYAIKFKLYSDPALAGSFFDSVEASKSMNAVADIARKNQLDNLELMRQDWSLFYDDVALVAKLSAEARNKIEADYFTKTTTRARNTLGLVSQFASGVSSSLEQMYDMQERKSQNLFNVIKGIKMAEAIIHGAMTTLSVYSSDIHPAAKPAFAAAFAAITAAQIGIIANTQPQAHGGIDYVPDDQTMKLKKGEMVLDPGTSAAVRRAALGNGGSGPITVTVNVPVQGGLDATTAAQVSALARQHAYEGVNMALHTDFRTRNRIRKVASRG